MYVSRHLQLNLLVRLVVYASAVPQVIPLRVLVANVDCLECGRPYHVDSEEAFAV